MFVCVHKRKSKREREREIHIYLYTYREREKEKKRKRDEKIDDDADDVIRYQPSTFKHKAQCSTRDTLTYLSNFSEP